MPEADDPHELDRDRERVRRLCLEADLRRAAWAVCSALPAHPAVEALRAVLERYEAEVRAHYAAELRRATGRE